MSKTFWAILVVTVGAMLGIFFLTGGNESNETTANATSPTVIEESDHIRGPQNAEITLWGYEDFQCPHCGQAEPQVQKLLEKYPDSVRFVFRHRPVTGQIAFTAAYAAEAAANQDKFWEMHDKLYETQDQWSGTTDAKQTFVKYAEELGLDTNQFEQDMDSQAVKQRVSDDVAIATKFDISSTPTFYLNDEKLDNSLANQPQLEQLSQRIEQQLEEGVSSKE